MQQNILEKSSGPALRPELQNILNDAVTGATKIASSGSQSNIAVVAIDPQ